MILISFYPKRSLKRTTASLQFDIGGAKLKHCIYCKIFCVTAESDARHSAACAKVVSKEDQKQRP